MLNSPSYTKIENSLVALRTRFGSIACGWIIQNSASCQLIPSSRRYTRTHIRLKPTNVTNGSHSRRANSSRIRNMRQRYYSKSIRGTNRNTASQNRNSESISYIQKNTLRGRRGGWDARDGGIKSSRWGNDINARQIDARRRNRHRKAA